ncbi:hypothetical protein SDC9_207141 [bioreactor metagenome]|uniref:Uncharacterized protein n=1 Tax=bioreactor metagenome TaxID=1076179 RepID=A0A645J8E9_9ZZZZ
MHLGDQRAGRIEDGKAAALGLLLHGLGDAVGREDQRGAGRHFVQLLDEDGALGLEVVDHKSVVHDLVAHIDGRTELGQCPLHDLDGAIHSGTKAARFGQQDFLGSHHFNTPWRYAPLARHDTGALEARDGGTGRPQQGPPRSKGRRPP